MTVPAVNPGIAGFVPWPEEIAARYRRAGYWTGEPLGSALWAAADTAPEAVCLVDDGLRLTYRELTERADGAASRLRELGLVVGDRVVVQLPNGWEYVVFLLACLRAGVVPVMTLPANRRREITSVVERTGARAIVVRDVVRDFDHQELARDVASEISGVDHVLVAGRVAAGHVDLHALCEPAAAPATARAELDAAAPHSESVALMLTSGGTTGTPKLVARTHADYRYMISRAAQLCRLGPSTVHLAVLPLGHGYPMAGPGILGVLLSGGRIVLLPSPSPERAFAAIEREQVTMTSLVPAALLRWLEHRAQAPGDDLRSLELVQVAGSRLADEVAERVTPALGCALQQVYGMAEGLLCMTRLDDPAEVVLRTQGRPICPDDELRLVDEDGGPVPQGEPGILLTRGPYTPRGYFRAPALDARAFTADGWYRTGDITRLRTDGNLVVEGRDKDVINRGGEKIPAEEVESYAYQLDAVGHAAAVAMPSPTLGEAICLYVVPVAGATVTLDDVRRHMAQAGVAAFTLPERLVLAAELPLTPIGKVDKKALRGDIAARLAAEASSPPDQRLVRS